MQYKGATSASDDIADKAYVDNGGGTKLRARKASDQTNLTSTTLADITSLSVTLPSTGYYRFYAVIPMVAVSGTSPTLSLGMTGPTATVVAYTSFLLKSSTGNTESVSAGAYIGTALTGQSGAYTVSANVLGQQISGYVEVTATGILKVQYKAAGTSPNFTAKAGATLLVEQILY